MNIVGILSNIITNCEAALWRRFYHFYQYFRSFLVYLSICVSLLMMCLKENIFLIWHWDGFLFFMAKWIRNITADNLSFHRMTQHLQYRLVVPPTDGGGVTGAKYACTRMLGKWFLNLLIPALVISWQSYNSILWRLWQETRWSKLASVIRGKLSSSKTIKCSDEHGAMPNWRIPSSVINSQWDKLINSSLGQQAESADKVASVMRTHSSKSNLSNKWQFRAKAPNPVSVNCDTAAHSNVVRFGHAFAIAMKYEN